MHGEEGNQNWWEEILGIEDKSLLSTL